MSSPIAALTVALPLSQPAGSYGAPLYCALDRGPGIVDINDVRDLSFRYYRIGGAHLAWFADDGFTAIAGSVAARSADRTEEESNG